MAGNYSWQLRDKAEGKKCDICDKAITSKEAADEDFEYSRTKRKNEVFVHKKCWRRLYG